MGVKFNSLLVKCFTSAFIYYVPQDTLIGLLIASKHQSNGTSITGFVDNNLTNVNEVANHLGIDVSNIRVKKGLAFTKYELV